MTADSVPAPMVPAAELLKLADWWEQQYVTDDGWPLICANQLRDVVKKAAGRK